MVVNEDMGLAVICFTQVMSRAYRRSLRLTLEGLEPSALYREQNTGVIRSVI